MVGLGDRELGRGGGLADGGCSHSRHPLPPSPLRPQIRFVLLLSRQGKVRLAKWYTTLSQKDRAKIMKEVTGVVLARPAKLCNFVDWKDHKIVYKRYASLYFVAGIDQGGCWWWCSAATLGTCTSPAAPPRHLPARCPPAPPPPCPRPRSAQTTTSC